jgi:hypothetical protein
MILAIVLLFSTITFSLDTILCYQTASGLDCHPYNGEDMVMFDYPEEWEYSGNMIGYTESEGMDSYVDNEEYEDVLIFEPTPPIEWWKFIPK